MGSTFAYVDLTYYISLTHALERIFFGESFISIATHNKISITELLHLKTYDFQP